MPEPEHFYDGAAYDPRGSVGLLLRRVSGSISRVVNARMEQHGLTQAQWGPLYLLQRCQCHTAAEVAREIGLDTGTVTRTLDRLEDKGFLRRERSTDDRRVVNLVLTPEGERAIAPVPHVIAEVLNAHLAGFTRAEHDQLAALLTRMLANGEQLLACRRSHGAGPSD
ncbi:MAG: MarR family transcriptional regulator [Aquabacterium sp.]|nr:MarR family transcriptional regulator [Dechloromonas sp.]MCH2241182.1 MarR family transcriptional regulator [Aquabacterium sp.]